MTHYQIDAVFNSRHHSAMAQEDRDRITALIAKLESHQAAIEDLIKQVKVAVSPTHANDARPGVRIGEKRKPTRALKKTRQP